MNNKIVTDVSCVVRSVGERTEKICCDILTSVGLTPHIVTGQPFYVTLKNAFQKAIELDKEYCLMIDADCIPFAEKIPKFIDISVPICDYTVLSKMDCNIFGMVRNNGVRLYKTKKLKKIINLIETVDRPESTLHKKYGIKNIDIICCQHGYEQYYKDLWRTIYMHGIKSKNSKNLKNRYDYWKSQSDIESKICAFAYEEGIKSKDKHIPLFDYKRFNVEEKGLL